MSNFDGIDRERAKKDIDSFFDEANNIYEDLWNEAYGFFDVLEEKWASPVACDYTADVAPRFQECCQRYEKEAEHIANGATDAANVLLAANGDDCIDVFRDPYPVMGPAGVMGDFSVCRSSINTLAGDSLVGMDKEGVRILLSTFKKQVQNLISRIDALPEGISFYDPKGDLVETYNRGLKSFKTEFQDLLDELINQMDIYINTEVDNILLAKQEAQEAMQA